MLPLMLLASGLALSGFLIHQGGETLLSSVDIIDLSESSMLGEKEPGITGRVQLDMLEPACKIELAGNYAYLASHSSAEFRVLDIESLAAPRLVSEDNPAGVQSIGYAMAFDGQHLFFSTRQGGLSKCSLVDPAKPGVISSLPTEGSVVGFALKSNAAESLLLYSEQGPVGGLRAFVSTEPAFQQVFRDLRPESNGRAVVIGVQGAVFQLEAVRGTAGLDRLVLTSWLHRGGIFGRVGAEPLDLGSSRASHAVQMVMSMNERHLLVGPLVHDDLLIIDVADVDMPRIQAAISRPGATVAALASMAPVADEIIIAINESGGGACEVRKLRTEGSPQNWVLEEPVLRLSGRIDALAVEHRGENSYAHIVRSRVVFQSPRLEPRSDVHSRWH